MEKKPTAMATLLKQIILKQVNGSVYLVPAITDVQIQEALEQERRDLEDSFNDAYSRGCVVGSNDYTNESDEDTGSNYFKKHFKQ